MQEPPEPIKVGAGEFACPLCPKTMKRKDHMKDHILIHTGEKRFFCTICHRFFNRKSSLNRHIEKTHAVGLVEPKIEMVIEQSSEDPKWIFRVKIMIRNSKSYNEIVNIVSSKQAKSPKVKYKENIKCYLCLELFIKYITLILQWFAFSCRKGQMLTDQL